MLIHRCGQRYFFNIFHCLGCRKEATCPLFLTQYLLVFDRSSVSGLSMHFAKNLTVPISHQCRRGKTIPEPIPSGKVILAGLTSGAVVDLKHRGSSQYYTVPSVFAWSSCFTSSLFRIILSSMESLLPRPARI